MSKKIRVAVIGVGNCFSSLYQGIHFYKDHDEDDEIQAGIIEEKTSIPVIRIQHNLTEKENVRHSEW